MEKFERVDFDVNALDLKMDVLSLSEDEVGNLHQARRHIILHNKSCFQSPIEKFERVDFDVNALDLKMDVLSLSEDEVYGNLHQARQHLSSQQKIR
jgi:hypothetical protein